MNVDNKVKSFSLKSSADLDPLIERIGNVHYVLLGEASHGTHEYYTWRSAITRRLIGEKGFNLIAVEGDWPDCYLLNRYIKGFDKEHNEVVDILESFDRWPTWMWANWEVAALIEWLKEKNTGFDQQHKIGFYGLDVYSLWQSMETMLHYLEQTDPHAAELAKNAMQCFEFFDQDARTYAREWQSAAVSCREHVIKLLQQIINKAPVYDHDSETALNIEQNAYIAVNAESYYRNLSGFEENTWNLRDTHMVDTLNRLTNFYGEEARAIVWAHNTHIGDARFTNMKDAGMINIGQLVREQRGQNDVVLVGFGSYEGTVIAGKNWHAPMEVMNMPAAKKNSIERLLHDESAQNKLFLLDGQYKDERFEHPMAHRAIGVVYHPLHEKHRNYVPTILNARYDAFIYLDKTRALYPLQIEPDRYKMPETYPFEY